MTQSLCKFATGPTKRNASLFRTLPITDHRVTRAGRQLTDDRIRSDRWKTRKDPRVGKPRVRPDQINRDRSKDRSNKKRPNDSASAPAQDAPAQVAEEVPLTRALNSRRFAEVQELPLQAAPTVANGQELRLRLVAVEHSSSVESSSVANALALARDARGTLPSPAHTTVIDPTADDAVGRFVESEQMVVEAPQVEHAVPLMHKLHSAQDLQLVSQAGGLSLNGGGDDAPRHLQRGSVPMHQPAAALSAAATAVSALVAGDTTLMLPPESYRTPNKPIVRSKEPPPPPSPRRLGASLFMISSEEGTLPNVMSMLRRAHPQP